MEEEYPDTNEEFELMHAEEMEMLNEMDNDQYGLFLKVWCGSDKFSCRCT